MYVDVIFKYKRTAHEHCAVERKVIIVTNAPDNASFSVGYIEDSITDVILDQTGVEP
jgi:hypothetical protein